jgi:hypothetical protein
MNYLDKLPSPPLPAAPSQPLAPPAMTQPPISPLATEVFDHAPASPAKRKGPVDTDHNLSAPSKKKKNDPIPVAKKSHTRKPGTKSKPQALSPVPGASTGSLVAEVSVTEGGKASSNKVPPAPRERSERYDLEPLFAIENSNLVVCTAFMVRVTRTGT